MSVENALSITIQQCWAAEQQIWLAKAQAKFALGKIVLDDTKYYYNPSALDQTTASRFKDYISHSPSEHKYDALKDWLLKSFILSEPEHAPLLLHFRPLGDTKPFALMDEMFVLFGNNPPCFLFQQLFLECLPENMSAQLIDEDIEDHPRLA